MIHWCGDETAAAMTALTGLAWCWSWLKGKAAEWRRRIVR